MHTYIQKSINIFILQVNICDDYSLPVDFVKKRPSSLEHCRDVKFADDFPSPSIVNEQVCYIYLYLFISLYIYHV